MNILNIEPDNNTTREVTTVFVKCFKATGLNELEFHYTPSLTA